jgi:hypothetical protein
MRGITRSFLAGFVGLTGMLVAGSASALVIDQCASNGLGFTCDLYESNAGTVTDLPNDVLGGYVVITSDVLNPSNVSAWRDVVRFLPIGIASTIDLLNSAALFPTFAAVSAVPNAFLGVDLPITTYTVTNNIYNFHLDGDDGTPVPEPASLALLGAGLLGYAFMRRRRA